MDLKAAGQELRRLREARGWSRYDLKMISSVSESSIRNYEDGRRMGEEFAPHRGKLRELAKAFGWPDGAEILKNFGEKAMAAQFEREAFNDPDEEIYAGLTPKEREAVREINRLIVALVTADR